jgi:hypothetical protein
VPRQRKPGIIMSLQVIAEREQRIVEQKQLIAELKRKGRSTEQAEAELKDQLLALTMLRNHSEIALELAKADPNELHSSKRSVQRRTSARNRDG